MSGTLIRLEARKHNLFRRAWLCLERNFLFNVIRLFRIRDQSEKVARGFALGLIVNFFPTFGFGVLISGFFARVFGGNAVAGLVGGATLTFFWPFLFLMNMKTGRIFIKPPMDVENVEEVAQKVDTLMLGHTFLVGSVVNSAMVGGAVYFLLRFVYQRIRPGALAFFRGHSKDHQRRFRRPRSVAA